MGHLNLYETLGVGHEDRGVAVRRAYRDLARLSHATTEAVPRFVHEMEIAFEVLSDETRRAHYDDRMVRDVVLGGEGAPEAVTAGGAAFAAAGAAAVEHGLDLLRDFEGGPPSPEEVWHAFRRNFAPGAEPKSAHIEALDLLIRLPEPESMSSVGMEVLRIELPVFHACACCHGTGSVDWSGCVACDGTGLAEERSALRLPAAPAGHLVSLAWLGVRSPILRIRVAAAAA